MARIKVPKFLAQYLAPDEEIIAEVSIARSMYYYATSKRLLVFKRSVVWQAFFGLLGLLAKKRYQGDVEYSKISGITSKKHRSKIQLIAGLIIGLPLLIVGIVFFTLPGATGLGVFFIILALLTVVIMSVMKQAYYQIESQDFAEGEMKKYRLNKPRIGGKKIDRFVELVRERVSK